MFVDVQSISWPLFWFVPVSRGFSVYVLTVLMIIGLLALNVVYATIVINYATQCELLVIMLRSISLQVNQKLVSLLDVMRVS